MASAVLNSRSSQAGGAQVHAVDGPVVQAGHPQRAPVAHALGQHVPGVAGVVRVVRVRCGPCPCSGGASGRPTPLGDSPAHRSGCSPMRRSTAAAGPGTAGRVRPAGPAGPVRSGIGHRRMDPVGPGVDRQPVVPAEAGQHQAGPFRDGHRQRRRRAHGHQRGEAGGPRLLDHLEAGPARHPQDEPGGRQCARPAAGGRPPCPPRCAGRCPPGPPGRRRTGCTPRRHGCPRWRRTAPGVRPPPRPGRPGPRRRSGRVVPQRLQPVDEVVHGLHPADAAGRGGGGQPRRGGRPPARRCSTETTLKPVSTADPVAQ